MSRTARREKQKTIRALLGLGFATSACAAVAGTLVWAWSPQMGTWTLSPQQDFADASRDAGPRGGRTWVPPELPEATWTGEHRGPDSAPTDVAQTDESTQIASIETKGENSSGYGPLDFSQNDNSGGNNFYGLFDSNGSNPSFGGGQGGSWNGTFNPNGGGSGRPGAFSSYSSGGGGTGNGGGGPSQSCEPGKTWNGSACVAPPRMAALAPQCDEGKVWNGSACVTPAKECSTGQHWDGAACVADESSSGGQCGLGQRWNGSSCIASETNQETGETGDPTAPSCGTGQHWNGTACVADAPAPNGQCEIGQQWDGTSCVANEEGPPPPPSGQCTSGQHWDGTICVADETDPQNGGSPGDNGPPTQNVSLPVQDPVAVPEPGSLLISLAALLGLGWSVRRRA